MTTAKSSKSLTSRRSLVWQSLFVVGMLIAARLVWIRTQLEPLVARPLDNSRISGDHIYALCSLTPPRWIAMPSGQVVPDDSEYGLQAQSIYEPKWRTLVPQDIHFPFCPPYTLGIAAGNLYYAVKPRSASLPQDTSGAQGGFLLTPQSPPVAPIPGNPRFRVQQTYPPVAEEVRFRQVSMQGGTPREVVTLHSDNYCLIDSHVFWIRPEKEEARMIKRDTNYRWETTAQSDLMLTSLTNGETRCIRHGVNRYTPLVARNTGVTWTELSPYPRHATLFYADTSDGVVHSLSFTGDQNLQSVFKFGNRLYWTRLISAPQQYNVLHLALMRSNLDGTDVREVITSSDHGLGIGGSLSMYRNTLYCYLTESHVNSPDRSQALLCRLHPDQSNPIEVLRKLPARTNFVRFDEGYCYVLLSERHRTLWANLTDDDVGQTFTYRLARVPL